MHPKRTADKVPSRDHLLSNALHRLHTESPLNIISKLTELSFLELRHGRIYTELGGDVTDELVAAVDAAAAEVSVAYHAKVQYMLALIRQMRQRGITASELDELELALVNLATDHITSADPGSDCKD